MHAHEGDPVVCIYVRGSTPTRNRLKVEIKASDIRLLTNSRWTAFVAKHTKS